MDERTAEVVKEIAQERRHLGDEIAQLERKLRAAADWRSYFARNPWGMMGIAACGGFLLAGLFTRRSR